MIDYPCKLCQFAKPLSLALTLCAAPLTASAQTVPAIPYSAAAVSQSAEPTGRFIVKYRSTKSSQSPRGKRSTRSNWRSKRQLKLERSLSSNTELLTAVDSVTDLNSLKSRAKQMSDDVDVEYASVEYRRYPLLEPNDPLYQGNQIPGNQSYLFDGVYSMQAPGAWDITTGSSSSVIAIVDTGVLPEHPAISNRSIPGLGYDFVSADAPGNFFSSNDNDGRDSNPSDPGDPCNNDPSTWHGTAVASVAAGNSNDTEGAAGIDWNAQLLHARALGTCGGTDADIIDAIRWSAGLSVPGIPDNQTPANVVNLSLGGPTECTRAWQDVIDELAERNIVFVMAAGNESDNALRSAPANCANVIAVGSSTAGGNIDGGFSNYGIKVTIATGGRNIVAASNRGLDEPNPTGSFYRTETGTSFSAALVSGAISLMHSIDPDLGPSEVRALLNESATSFATGTNCDFYYCGAGILDLSRALTQLRDGNFNPQRDTAQELILSQSTPALLQQQTNGTLSGFRDIRYFTISVPERGLLQVESAGQNDLYGYLLNEQLSVVALDDDNGDATNFRVASVVDPGTYYIAVERERHRLVDGEIQFTVAPTLSTDQPAAFVFASLNNATPNDLAISNTVTVSGLLTDSVVTVSDGFYSLNGADLTLLPGTIRNGDTLQLALQSPGSGDSNTVTVTVGAYTTGFTVSTADGAGNSDQFLAGNAGGGNGGNAGGSGCTVNNSAAFDPIFLLCLLLAGLGLTARRTHL